MKKFKVEVNEVTIHEIILDVATGQDVSTEAMKLIEQGAVSEVSHSLEVMKIEPLEDDALTTHELNTAGQHATDLFATLGKLSDDNERLGAAIACIKSAMLEAKKTK